MTLYKWVHDPIILGTDPIFEGSWGLQVDHFTHDQPIFVPGFEQVAHLVSQACASAGSGAFLVDEAAAPHFVIKTVRTAGGWARPCFEATLGVS